MHQQHNPARAPARPHTMVHLEIRFPSGPSCASWANGAFLSSVFRLPVQDKVSIREFPLILNCQSDFSRFAVFRSNIHNYIGILTGHEFFQRLEKYPPAVGKSFADSANPGICEVRDVGE